MAGEIPAARPAYFAVIPAKVRYDQSLRASAKLLYGEITALANASGYCFASNSYFAVLYGRTAKTISELIGELEARGYVSVNIVRDLSGEIVERQIYVDAPRITDGGIPKNRDTPPEKSGYPIPKNREENNTSINNIPPIAPQGGKRAKKSKTAPGWKPDRFSGFWDYYPRHESKQAAIRAWDKLKPSDDLIAVIARALERAKKSEEWQRGIGIPYASTWLNQERWTDEPTPITRQPAAAATGWADDPEVL